MTDTRPPAFDDQAPAGPATANDERRRDNVRRFPCEQCGAELEFDIHAQSLKCPYCGFAKELTTDPDAFVGEQDFAGMIDRLRARHAEKREQPKGLRELRCTACGAVVSFAGTLASTECAYCGASLQLDGVYDAPDRVPVDGVLPFIVERKRARGNLAAWVRSRWFAPNDFRRRGVEGRFNGVFAPYWTFDSATATHYTGRRGDHYWVTTGTGKNKRRERRTRWRSVSGAFRRFFDDILIVASGGLPQKRVNALEPWPLARCRPFNQEMLAGFLARTYDVELDAGFTLARAQMDDAIAAEVRQRIGGDVQVVNSINTRYDAVTYKYLLLPIWMLAYRYGEKSYQVVVNAATGEVQGDRPYSWVKILLAIVFGLAAVAVIAFIASHR